MLNETVKKFKDFVLGSKFYKVQKYFSTDKRFWILDEKDREEYFQDFMDDWEKREVELRKFDKNKADRMKILNKIQGLYWNSRIKPDMTWANLLVLMKENTLFKNSHPIDWLEAFKEYILDLDE